MILESPKLKEGLEIYREEVLVLWNSITFLFVSQHKNNWDTLKVAKEQTLTIS